MMDNTTFNKLIKPLNIKYKALFGYIPRIIDFSCTREEYILALQQAVKNNIPLNKILISYEKGGKNSMFDH